MIAQLDQTYLKTRPTKLWNRLINYILFEGRPVTTRGRWINPIVFSSFKVWGVLPQLKKVEKPIFIVGTGRSGTTLTGILLSIHKEISFLNEPKALWHKIYKYEDIIGSYSKGEAHYQLTENDLDDSAILRAHKLYSANLAITGTTRIVDKYPELIYRIPFVQQIFPDAKFIFIVRNGYDTLQSIEQWSDRLGEQTNNEIHDWWGVNGRKWALMVEQLIPQSELLKDEKENISQFTNHKDRATVEWILTMEKGLKEVQKKPESLYLLKFEELLDRPEEIINSVLNFAEISLDQKVHDYAAKILKEPARKREVEINITLRPAFRQLMTQLNYES